MRAPILLIALFLGACALPVESLRGTGDLGLVVERASGSLLLIEHSDRSRLAKIEGLGDVSHASIVYSRDGRYGFVFGRDGGLTKVDLLQAKVVARKLQAGNAIGGAISQDGRLVAVSNYEPGGVKIFDSDTLTQIANIPTQSKTVGLVDAPGNRFVFSLFDSGEIWVADLDDPQNPKLTKFEDVGIQPYDALITPDGRYYIAGLFGEDGMVLLDLWNLNKGPRRILDGYGRGEEKLPVYKMPHLEGWAMAGDLAFVPAVGRHEVLVMDRQNWRQVGRIATHGQPVFVMAQPDGRRVWVNFAFPRNDTIQVIDTQTLAVVDRLTPGKGVLHMEFTPRGEEVWMSVRDLNLIKIYDTHDLTQKAQIPAQKPSGIFFTWRAGRIGL